MAISKEKGVVIKDDTTLEEVELKTLDSGNYIIIINGVENQLKPDIFEELGKAIQEVALG